MKTLKNNKGVTLVEIIVGVAIFAIAAVALVQGFVSSANIINRATLYKNASAATSSTVELQEVQESEDTAVDVDLAKGSATITIKGVNSKGHSVQIQSSGEIFTGTDTGDSELKYKEFVPGSYDLDVE